MERLIVAEPERRWWNGRAGKRELDPVLSDDHDYRELHGQHHRHCGSCDDSHDHANRGRLWTREHCTAVWRALGLSHASREHEYNLL